MAKKKRTKAERSAAAKAFWARRKAAALPSPVPAEVRVALDEAVKTVFVTPPKIGYAVKEGVDIFICFGEDGSLRRERVSLELAKKVYMDLAKIVV